jgi:hypothetical protein
MIKFPCKCGHRFELADDMAGGLIQCPDCGTLNDVPTLSELPFINTDDGTIKLEEVEPAADADDPVELAEMEEAFSPHTVDARGHEKDLRHDVETLRHVGVDEAEEPNRIAPRYDPVTGDLIRPMDIKDEAPRPVLPVESTGAASAIESDGVPPLAVIPVEPLAAPKSIGYAVGESRRQISPSTLAVELLMPANVVVLLFVFLFYLFAGFIGTLLAVGALYLQISLQVLNVPLWLLISHYGCVIEDTGPDSRDELPRPLRHFSLSDDLWNPFFNVMLAGLICYFPVAFLSHPRLGLGPYATPLMILFEMIGSFFFPAVLLTAVTGTTVLNLRPDRVLAVIRKCGGDYILAVGVFLLSTLPTIYYLVSPQILPAKPNNPIFERLAKPYVMLPALAVAVYLAHYFCWFLGLMYRAHHHEFPWLMQRHIRTPREGFDVVGRTAKRPKRSARSV